MTTPNKKLPEGWQWVKLGDVCEILSGATPNSNVDEYWNGDITWVTPTDLGQLKSKFIIESLRMITEKGYQSCSTVMAPPGSVVMSSRAPIGHLGIASVPLCVNQGCKIFVPKQRITSEFLYFDLLNRLAEIRNLGAGATFQEVSKTKLTNFEIPLPPLAEQQRIVASLEAQMAAAERAQKAAEESLEAIKALNTSFLRKLLPSLGQQLPQFWKWVKLGDVCKINPRKSSDLVYPPEAMTTFVPMSSVSEITGTIVQPETVTISQVSKGYTYFEEGDVLFAKITPCMQNGKHAIARDLINGFGFGSTEFHVIRPGEKVTPEWVHHIIRQKRVLDDAAKHFRGAVGQQRVPKEFLEELLFPLPPQGEQRRIVSELELQEATTDRARQTAQAALVVLGELPDALLRRAFAGEI